MLFWKSVISLVLIKPSVEISQYRKSWDTMVIVSIKNLFPAKFEGLGATTLQCILWGSVNRKKQTHGFCDLLSEPEIILWCQLFWIPLEFECRDWELNRASNKTMLISESSIVSCWGLKVTFSQVWSVLSSDLIALKLKVHSEPMWSVGQLW